MAFDECPITEWKHTPGHDPELKVDNETGMFQIVCPCCWLTSGMYVSQNDAEKRWKDLAKDKIRLEDYNNRSFEENFPDHKDKSYKKPK